MGNKVSSMVGVVACGPWGGSGGSSFDEGAYTGIKQINISRNVGIVYIKVLYDRNGESVWGSKHGGTGGFRTEKVQIISKSIWYTWTIQVSSFVYENCLTIVSLFIVSHFRSCA